MSQDEDRPANLLLHPAHTAESTLAALIKDSGYPLRMEVTDGLLASGFEVLEDWGFGRAGNAKRHRIDITANKILSQCPSLNAHFYVIAKCHRSKQPFIFFRSKQSSTADFPRIRGTPGKGLRTFDEKSHTYVNLPLALSLNLHRSPFVAAGPPTCRSLCKVLAAVGKGQHYGDCDLLLAPLLETSRYSLSNMQLATGDDNSLFLGLQMCILVLDAPMGLANSAAEATRPVAKSWIRVSRIESFGSREGSEQFLHTVDVVHVDFWHEFLREHLLPFAAEFGQRAMDSVATLREGARVADLSRIMHESLNFRPMSQPLP